MATTLSADLANTFANPLVPQSQRNSGDVVVLTLTHELPVSAAADVCILQALPAHARVAKLEMATDDMGTTGTMSVGLYKLDSGPDQTPVFSALSTVAFASALDVNTAAVPMTDRRFTVKDIATINQPLWQLAGLSAKPDYGTIYLGISTPAATTAIGTVSMRIHLKQD